MKLQWLLKMLAAMLVFQVTALRAEERVELKSVKDKTSYAIGVQTARNFKKDNIEIDLDLVMKGMKDGYAGDKLLIPEKELRSVMAGLLGEMRQKMVANRKELGAKNKLKGEEFLAANKTKEGVVTLPNGIQYKILKAGDGKKPAETGIVSCIYRGTLLDGTQFDGTDDGKTSTLKISQLIMGWKEALKLMPVGSKWQIFLPYNLAYGERGVGADVGPNETLTFEVELLGIK